MRVARDLTRIRPATPSSGAICSAWPADSGRNKQPGKRIDNEEEGGRSGSGRSSRTASKARHRSVFVVVGDTSVTFQK
ncbi:hypothetical protein NL676_010904 [Syzygium grande]|nr:hypothetical protein NL676_010904 [Syzygium grande]